MAIYMLTHHHNPDDCRTAFVAWQGFESPLRHHPTLSSCVEGGHCVWWRVEAADDKAAVALLPPWIAERTEAIRVREVPIP
ncbi:MAG: hypothetical protein GEU88_08760 [Solirubrobacterales bacterium]|nr:hypothetical protein [Solirubrobacterales bacterium]